MWFEILPGAGIIFVMLSIPGYAFYGLNKLVNDNVSATVKKKHFTLLFRLHNRDPYILFVDFRGIIDQCTIGGNV